MSGASVTSSSYTIDPAYTRDPPIALLKQIDQFQRDGLLFLDHLTKRPSRRFTKDGQPEGDAQADGSGKGSDLSFSVKPLQMPAAEVARDKDKFQDLILLVDALARLAYPATPETIRKSRKKIAGSDIFLLILMLVGLVFAVSALWRVDEGRKLVSDTRIVQSQAKTTYTNLFRLSIADFEVYECVRKSNETEDTCNLFPNLSTSTGQEANLRHRYPYCKQDESKVYPKYYLQAKSADAKQLCAQLGEQRVRENLSFARLRGWNCEIAKAPLVGALFLGGGGVHDSTTTVKSRENPETGNASRSTDVTVLAEGVAAPNAGNAYQANGGAITTNKVSSFHYTGCSDASSTNTTQSDRDLEHDWRRSELRAVPVLHLLSHHLLPGALALLGASVSLLLSRYRARNTETLRDGWLATTVLVIMPTALGALIGIVWGGAPDTLNSDQIKVGEFSFGIGAIAFFIGFIFEDFLNWLKRTLVTTLENNGAGKMAVK